MNQILGNKNIFETLIEGSGYFLDRFVNQDYIHRAITEEKGSEIMPKILEKGTVPRKSALWVREYYHTAAGFCARASRVSVGEFVEAALDAYITSESEFEPLKPALDNMRIALTEVGRVSREIGK